ncbi:MAG TPA: non-heme iron oxygenase ferredoxin subunit [Streptosporangiaceae bacterium]|nr:non-heme iron oxygenase ferredoxin subunit [Streptosporangiaceae bacterium]
MSADTGQSDGSAPAAQPARPASAAAQAENWHHEVVARIDNWGWIRTLNDQLTAVLGPWRERNQGHPVIELMHGGRWAGHPLHPALSDLPIGLWTGALILDIADRDPAPRRGMEPAALFSALGIAAAVATAATGVVDWTVSDDQDRRLGLFHGVLNTAALGLQGVSLAARLTGHRRPARGLGAASLAVTGAAAYLGGHLVFAKAVMVNRVAGADGPRRWVRVAEEAELPDDVPTGVLADGRQILLYRHDGTLYALDNLCSHAAGLLSRGTVEGLTVTCPLHGSQYCLADGSVRRGPSHQPQPVIRTRTRNGWIEVRGSQPAPRRRANERK